MYNNITSKYLYESVQHNMHMRKYVGREDATRQMAHMFPDVCEQLLPSFGD